MKIRNLLCATLLFVSSTAISEQLNVVAINSGATKQVTASLLREFEQANPGIQVNFQTYPDAEYKEKLPQWLSASRAENQVYFWQGGKRLFQFVERGQVKSLNELYDNTALSNRFTKGSMKAVNYGDEMYAIPLSYYQWGIYYRKSIFAENNLIPPTNWQELLTVSTSLKNKGIAPFTLGNEGKWPASAWFDYLNLRINGLKFHTELLNGEHSFQSPQVAEVFEHWKQLIDRGYFIEHHSELDWDEAIPFIYHDYAAMVLIGNFATGTFPDSLKSDFDFMPFPRIKNSIASYEDAPMDVVMIAENAQKTEALKKLVDYIASELFQSRFNQETGMISPHRTVPVSNDLFLRKGAELLNKADGVAQFFDRDTQQAFVGPALDVFQRFLTSGNVSEAQQSLEKLRQLHLVNR